MGKTYQEDNCIERRHFTKTVSSGSYQLHHTTHLGWGYVYIVELCGGADGNQCTSTPSYGR